MQVKQSTDQGLLFESSWEVCNKIGGIYTVLSTKAKELKKAYGDRLIFVGPDVWTDKTPSPYFVEDKKLLSKAEASQDLPWGIKIRTGRWAIPGTPVVVLVDFKGVFDHLDEIYGEMWNKFGVDSLHAYGDYAEGCAFAVASAIVMKYITEHLKANPADVIAHFDEWTTGMGLLYLKTIMPEAATVFTTHATSIGRSICGNGKPLYEYFTNYDGDQMARELNMEAKHSLEKTAAREADCFTTVSDVTARECTQLLGVTPQVVTPNGFEAGFVPEPTELRSLRRKGRKRLLEIAEALTGEKQDSKAFIIATSGRNEYRNKGLDLFLDSMEWLEEYCKDDEREILAFVLVPAWSAGPSADLLDRLGHGGEGSCDPDYLTHRLHNEDSDAIACRIRQLEGEGKFKKLKVIYVPCYLDGHDGVVNIPYYDLLPALDATVFASYYEPWGYTPLESIAFGVPTVTTDKAGFGLWADSHVANALEKSGVKVVERNDNDYELAKQEIAGTLRNYYLAKAPKVSLVRKAASVTARLADWSIFITEYFKAYEVARKRHNQK